MQTQSFEFHADVHTGSIWTLMDWVGDKIYIMDTIAGTESMNWPLPYKFILCEAPGHVSVPLKIFLILIILYFTNNVWEKSENIIPNKLSLISQLFGFIFWLFRETNILKYF